MRRVPNLVLCVVLVCAAFAALPQSPARPYRIGLLANQSTPDPSISRMHQAFWDGLRDLGYERGGNVVVETRYSEGRTERFPALAKELVESKVDLIVVSTTPAGIAAKSATTSIPILFPMAIDPVGTGLVASLSQPGGNATGLTTLSVELSGKRVELLKQLVPGLSKLAVLHNPDNPGNLILLRETEHAARQLKIAVRPYELRKGADLNRTLTAIARQQPNALLILPDPITFSPRHDIARFAVTHGLPSLCAQYECAAAGALVSYGPSYTAMWRRAATYADKILKGTDPRSLPVEQMSEFELILNMRTAQALRIEVPRSLRMQANEVIQ